MPSPETKLADLLLQHSVRLSEATARRFLDHHLAHEAEKPELLERWTVHYGQRIRELSAALRFDERNLFLSDLLWSRTAFRSREVADETLQASLDCLRAVIADEFEPPLRDIGVEWTDCKLSELRLEDLRQTGEEELREEGLSLASESPEGRLALSYLESMLDGDRQSAIRRILNASDRGMSIEDICDRVLIPAQRHVGDMWHQNEVVVAQEHFVTETTTAILAMLTARAPAPDPNGCTLMICTTQGNAHDLGSRLIADAFERSGWNVIFLGADLPLREILLGIEAFSPDVLALSASLTVHLTNLATTVRATREAYPEVKIMKSRSLSADASSDGHLTSSKKSGQTAWQTVSQAGSRLPTCSWA